MVAVPVDRFGRPLAAWWQRLVAIIIDGIIIDVPKSIIAAIVVGSGAVYSTHHIRAGLIVIDIIFIFIDLVYFALLNGSEKGQTVGQMALGIAVRDENTGGTIGPQRAAIRILILIPGIVVGWIPIIALLAGLYTIVAGLSPLWDSRRQGFHDKAQHTDVVKVR
jgi:uncharacterized RDD family membrane protein YckC